MNGSITVVVAFDGTARDLEAILADIRRQSRAAGEIMIVDASRDDSRRAQLIERLRRDSIRVLPSTVNTMAALLNQHRFCGDYVVLVTERCVLEPEYFEQAAAVLDSDVSVDFACSIDAELTGLDAKRPRVPSWLDALATWSAPHPAMMFRRQVLENAANVTTPMADDPVFFANALRSGPNGVALAGPFVTIPENLDGTGGPGSILAADRGRRRHVYLTLDSQSASTELLQRKECLIQHLQARSTQLDEQQARLHHELSAVRAEVRTLTRSLEEHGEPRVAWADLRRVRPLSLVWGSERGKPVNRYYIEQFLAAHRRDIRGRVLEVKDSSYADAFGIDLASVDVLDVNPSNRRATIIADLARAHSVASNAFDCFILTQVLNVVYDAKGALEHALRILRPGGVLLCTVASVDRLSYEDRGGDGDFWRFTDAALRTLLREVCPLDHYEVKTYGNVMACAAHLYGLAAEELAPHELEVNDPAFPLIVAARAVKPRTDTVRADG